MMKRCTAVMLAIMIGVLTPMEAMADEPGNGSTEQMIETETAQETAPESTAEAEDTKKTDDVSAETNSEKAEADASDAAEDSVKEEAAAAKALEEENEADTDDGEDEEEEKSDLMSKEELLAAMNSSGDESEDPDYYKKLERDSGYEEYTDEDGNTYYVEKKCNIAASEYIHNSKFASYDKVQGIDVSRYQGSINWTSVKADGIDFAICRIGYSSLKSNSSGQIVINGDDTYLTNVYGAASAGLNVGVYYFSQATTVDEAVNEANAVIYKMQETGTTGVNMPVFIDYEYGSGSNKGRLYNAGLSQYDATMVVAAFCQTIQNAGLTAGVYANKTMLESHLYGDSLASYYKVWLANYTTQTSYAGGYTYWQCSSSKTVNGISGNVDFDWWYKDHTYNPNRDAIMTYINNLYTQCLGRSPSSEELDNWVNNMAALNTGAIDAAYGFLFSTEMNNKNLCDDCFVRKLYLGMMLREADADGLATWKQYLAQGVSRETVFNYFTESTEFTNIVNYMDVKKGSKVSDGGTIFVGTCGVCGTTDSTTAFVTGLYKECLDRTPDSDGLKNWVVNLKKGSVTGAKTAYSFVFSDEFKNKNLCDSCFIKKLYLAILGREAEAQGLTDWTNLLAAGTLREEVFNGFVQSTEFSNKCSNYGITCGDAISYSGTGTFADGTCAICGATSEHPCTEFVRRLYRVCLDRGADAVGLQDWVGKLKSGEATGTSVAYGFFFSNEFQSKDYDDDTYVEYLYKAMLDRSSDADGKSYWLWALKNGDTRETVFYGFANSTEFGNLCSEYKIQQ